MSKETVLAEVKDVIAGIMRMPADRVPTRLRLTRGAANDVAVVLGSRGFRVDLPTGEGYIPLCRFVEGVSASQQAAAQ